MGDPGDQQLGIGGMSVEHAEHAGVAGSAGWSVAASRHKNWGGIGGWNARVSAKSLEAGFVGGLLRLKNRPAAGV